MYLHEGMSRIKRNIFRQVLGGKEYGKRVREWQSGGQPSSCQGSWTFSIRGGVQLCSMLLGRWSS